MGRAKGENNIWKKIATFIVDKRNGVFLVFIGLLIFSIFSSQWVDVNEDLVDYLPDYTETRIGMDLMEEEFLTYATANVMVANITLEKARDISETLENINGVSGVEFEDDDEHYKSSSALYEVTFEGEESDKITSDAVEEIKSRFSKYDLYVDSEVGSSTSDILDQEMQLVMLIAVVIIVSVLLFTSQSYLEVLVLLMTFASAALLNAGSNFIFGEISFISDSVAIILQLALAINYAIILSNRYFEERESKQPREAVIAALSQAMPEISSSSLTTISGLFALMLMQFKIGSDLGLVLIKAILLSIMSVFLLMPGLIMVFNKGIDKTRHKNFVPKIDFFGKLVVKTRYIIPPIFIIILIAGFYFSNKANFVYGYSKLETITQNQSQIADDMIYSTFEKTNLMAMLVPNGDYEKEGKLINDLESLEVTDSVQGLANIEAGDDHNITDSLTTRQFSELANLDISAARILYTTYALENEAFGQIINNIDAYDVPLIDMFFFLKSDKFSGIADLDREEQKDLDDMYEMLNDAKLQLEGSNYSRILIDTYLPEEGGKTFKYLDKIHEISDRYYSDDVYLVGESTNNYDLMNFFKRDEKVIGITTAIFVMVVLLFTFQSAGIPILLMMIIQGSIWINFSIPYLRDVNVFFISYLIVSSIQMGANIDYAIIITGRYQKLKQNMPTDEAIIIALNQAFPTVLTSGSILASAGLLIGILSSEHSVSSIGLFLGIGTIISMFLVMAILPQILLLGNKIIDRTGFKIKSSSTFREHIGEIDVDGHVKGYISGSIDAKVNGKIKGSLDAVMKTSNGNTRENSNQFKEDGKDENQK